MKVGQRRKRVFVRPSEALKSLLFSLRLSERLQPKCDFSQSEPTFFFFFKASLPTIDSSVKFRSPLPLSILLRVPPLQHLWQHNLPFECAGIPRDRQPVALSSITVLTLLISAKSIYDIECILSDLIQLWPNF